MVASVNSNERRLIKEEYVLTTENTEFAETVKDFSVFLMYSKLNLFNNPTYLAPYLYY